MTEFRCEICGARAEGFNSANFLIEHRGLRTVVGNLSGVVARTARTAAKCSSMPGAPKPTAGLETQ